MITIHREEEPDHLARNKDKWLRSFLQKRQSNPGLRPDSSKYGHPQIRDALRAMSSHKCFYCERKLNAGEDEVDHYIAIVYDETKAFDWNNLYLSCKGCNEKVDSVAITGCLDPCSPQDNPAKHLAFDDECIRPRDNSIKGRNTIARYRLGRSELDLIRSKQLQRFTKFLLEVRNRQVLEGRKTLTAREKEQIRSYMQPDHEFSLMFREYQIMYPWMGE